VGGAIARLIVISGPSGAGKGTIIKRVMKLVPGLKLSVSDTTRPRRRREREGNQYHFIDATEFRRRVEEGLFLEWAEYTGNLYGTPLGPVEEAMAGGTDVILEIELKGADKVLAERPEVLMIYIMPPSFEELERRLRNRATDSEAAISDRLARAKDEMAEVEKRAARGLPPLHYVIVNDRVKRASEELAGIIERTRDGDEQADNR